MGKKLTQSHEDTKQRSRTSEPLETFGRETGHSTLLIPRQSPELTEEWPSNWTKSLSIPNQLAKAALS